VTLKGECLFYDTIDQIKQLNGFVFHAFSSSNNCFITNLSPIKSTEIIYYHQSIKPYILSQNEYLETCQELIKTLKTKKIDKIVLSRIKKVDLQKHPFKIFEALNQQYKKTFNYLISIENVGTWIGATPELLVEIKNKKIKTVALAGTKLLEHTNWTDKEFREQKIVTDFISKQLKPYSRSIKINGPFTIYTGAVFHLKTEIEAVLNSEELWIETLNKIHPTPATCGLPQQKALQLILKHEPHIRDYYTGFLGQITKNEKLLMVNLRCMQIIKNEGYLYLGGGLTSDSIAIDEWRETENKAKTLLKVLE
jgi:isochorismate synthase